MKMKKIHILIGLILIGVIIISLWFALPSEKKETISCNDNFDCPEKMKCDNSICVDVGCLGEGEVVPSTAVSPEGFEERKHMATECCEGLEGIPTLNIYDKNCNWQPPPPGVRGGRTVCSNCGNGNCEEWETKCNCPEDCSVACRDQNYECTIDDIPCCPGLKEVLLAYKDKGGECVAPVPCGSICVPCGDGICEDTRLENICNCPEDCDASGGPTQYGECGDGICDNGENTPSYPYYCPEDCE